MTTATKKTPSKAPADGSQAGQSSAKTLEARWGKEAIAGGYTVAPDVLIRSMKELQLERLDLLVVLVLATYWRAANDMPFPSKETIAAMLDVNAQTVRRSIQKMETMGYVVRKFRKSAYGDNQTNRYDMSGLAKEVNRLAKEKAKVKAKRQAEDQEAAAAPKSAKLKLKLVKGT